VSARKELAAAAGRRFARLATVAATRLPVLWPLFRAPVRRLFDRIAPRWDDIRDPAHLAPYEAALAAVDPPPRRALDLGTGTGAGALAIARRFPGAEVVGVDLAEGMLAEARQKTPPELAARVRFQRADAARLPFPDASFDLVTHANMIPFYDELARVLTPGGFALFGFSSGPATPIYVAPERLREQLEQLEFSQFADFAAGNGTALLARKRATG
jgi:ubiquinone/menaquinone biosynthesis C-methylase UbiE